MNTSRSYSENYPTDLDVFVSYDGVNYQKAASINNELLRSRASEYPSESSFAASRLPRPGTGGQASPAAELRGIRTQNKIDQTWSPNKGKMITIPLDNFEAKFIKIVINETINNQAVMFDEVVIDNILATKYTMEQIWEYKNSAFFYVENQELLNQLVSIGAYRYLPFIYACAEGVDWEKQKSNPYKLVHGVWNVELFQINDNQAEQNVSIPINCYGSVLRKIIIIGPPVPKKLEIKEVFLK